MWHHNSYQQQVNIDGSEASIEGSFRGNENKRTFKGIKTMMDAKESKKTPVLPMTEYWDMMQNMFAKCDPRLTIVYTNKQM